MPDREQTIQTPHGPATVTMGAAGLPMGFRRFDSRDIERLVDRVLGDNPALRTDAGGGAAFARQLEYHFAEVLNVEYPEFRAAEFIPVTQEVPPGYLTYTYRMFDKSGAARIISNLADDLPNVDVGGREWPSPIVTTGASYMFDVMSQYRQGIIGVPIEQMRANACRWAIEYLGEQIAAIGAPNYGVPGLVNAPGVTGTTQVSSGTWLAQLAAVGAATPSAPAAAVAAVQGIVTDINAMTSKITTVTNGLYTPDTMLLPVDLAVALRSVPRSPAFTNDNILDYVSAMTNLKVDMWAQLNNASGTGKGRVMVYKKDPNILRLVRPLMFTQMPPQPKSLAWQVPCYAQEGGVMVLRPAAVTYMDGLDG